MNLPVLANMAVFALTLGYLYQRRKGGASISSNVLLAVLLGVVLGALASFIPARRSTRLEVLDAIAAT